MRLAAAALLSLAMGCFPQSGSNGSDGGTSNQRLTSPALQITVGGLKLGPTPLAAGSFADIVDDGSSGALTRSAVDISALTTLGDSCTLHVERNGSGTLPIGAGVYPLQTPMNLGDASAVSPGAGESAHTSQGDFACFGTDCDGGVLSLDVAAADHVEGYLLDNLADSAGRGVAQVVCYFWVPVRTYRR